MSENHSTMANVGKQIKEGRHVGLDFYDLLIEALIDPDRAKSPSMRVMEILQQASLGSVLARLAVRASL